MTSISLNGLVQYIISDSTATTETARANVCPNEHAGVVGVGSKLCVLKYLLTHAQRFDDNGLSDLSNLYDRHRHEYESTFRMLSYRWNELQTYNSFLVRCMLVTSVGLIIISLANSSFISRTVMNALVVVLVILILVLALIEYGQLRLRARKDFQKMRF